MHSSWSDGSARSSGPPRCAAHTVTDIVTAAVTALFIDRTPSAVDDHFGPRYTQHSALGVDGLDGVRALAATLPPGFRYELLRVLADGDLAVTIGLFHGYAPVPVVGFDVWRVHGERIVEHWDALAPLLDPATLDGIPHTHEAADPVHDRRTVTAWIAALIRGSRPDDLDRVGVVHHGITAGSPGYRAQRQVIADGGLVFTRSEGALDGAPAIVNDLWSLSHGVLTGRWNLTVAVPPSLPHDNGSF
jgi:predicted SnoaL-like aldol condensation-catalyzing enzyme